MTRTYVKSKRADNQAETRQRIVEAAVELHGEIGPGATTISMIAERAGVQRHTIYAHFPDDRSMLMACSGLHLAHHPIPSPDGWTALGDPAARIRAALAALYAWYAATEAMTAGVLRDAERSPLVREISDLRFGTPIRAIHASLAPGLGARGKAALTLALSFHTWRALVRDARLGTTAAVALMTRTVIEADGWKS
jgi:AcrR family transcriptional regulator